MTEPFIVASMPFRAEALLNLPVTNARWQTVVTITPEKAKIILDNQPSQRPINKSNLTKIKDEIIQRRWRRTHQGIAFNQHGLLTDGQHRLRACFETGISIEVMAHFNEPHDMFPTYDGGAVRGMHIHIYLAGIASNPSVAKAIAPTLRFIWAYDRGTNPAHFGANIGRSGWSLDNAYAVLDCHPRIPHWVDVAMSRRIPGLPVSILAPLFTLMDEADAQKCALFSHQIMTGENIKSGDPAYTFRETSSRLKYSLADVSYRMVRSWNAFYEGRSLNKLYGSITPNAEKVRTMGAFPEILGYRRPSND
jgi:hypothetical protein